MPADFDDETIEFVYVDTKSSWIAQKQLHGSKPYTFIEGNYRSAFATEEEMLTAFAEAADRG